MEVLEFRKIRVDDRHDKRFDTWSRIYEYPMVLDMITKWAPCEEISVHNSSWGHQGCHITFKNALEEKYETVVNSDIAPSKVPNTCLWDITLDKLEYKDMFDVVLNVSTVEEVNFNHVTILENLLNQVKPNGLLIITFDVPGLQLEAVEKFVGKKVERFDNELSSTTSAIPIDRYHHLSCGLLVIRKTV